jgi:hypothetical protein
MTSVVTPKNRPRQESLLSGAGYQRWTSHGSCMSKVLFPHMGEQFFYTSEVRRLADPFDRACWSLLELGGAYMNYYRPP